MSRLPTRATLEHLVEALRRLGQRPKPNQPVRIDDLERRILTAVERDQSGDIGFDGWDATTIPKVCSGSGRGSRVEGHGLALADGATPRDRHHELTVLAVESLNHTVTNLNTLLSALASIDDLIKVDGPGEKTRTCGHCTGKRGKGNDRPVYATGTAGDRLERAIPLCEACYGFVTQTAAPASRIGSLPDNLQIVDHERRGRWRIRTTARTQ